MPAIKQELALRSAGRKGAIARLNAGLLSTHTRTFERQLVHFTTVRSSKALR